MRKQDKEKLLKGILALLDESDDNDAQQEEQEEQEDSQHPTKQEYTTLELPLDLQEENPRMIVLNAEVTAETTSVIATSIALINKEDKDIPVEEREPIVVWIDSPGGSVTSGMGLVNVIECSVTPVIGVVCGNAASMACLLSMAFDTTYSFKDSVFLLHDGEITVSDSTGKFEDAIKLYYMLEDKKKNFVTSHTNITPEYYEEVYRKELYLSADEAKELGIVDYIIGEDVDLDEIL